MPLAAGALTALVAVYLFLAACAATIWLARGRENAPQGILAVHLAALGLHAGMRAAASVVPESAIAATATAIALGVGLALHAFLVLFLLARARSFARPAAAAIALVFGALAIHGGLHPPPSGSGESGMRVLAIASSTATGLGVTAAVAFVALALFFVTARALTDAIAERDRSPSRVNELLARAIGDALLVAGTLHDLATARLGDDGMRFGTFGLFAASTGSLGAFILRYASVERELRDRTLALGATSVELRASYDALDATRAELERKAQLAVIGELAAVVAHEVRNPLAVIANAIAALKRPTLAKGDQTLLLEILEEESSRLNRLVSELLGYARPVSVQRTRVALQDLLLKATTRAVERGNLRRAEAQGDESPRPRPPVELEFEAAAEGATVHADAGLLHQVFDNLVSNAIQAMPNGGRLRVKVKRDEIEGESGMVVEIADTGEGMDTLVRARARDPFFTTRPSGTGLGLAIVDRIVEAHGGHFLIQSLPGEGTVVSVFLPCRASSTSSGSIPPSSDNHP